MLLIHQAAGALRLAGGGGGGGGGQQSGAWRKDVLNDEKLRGPQAAELGSFHSPHLRH